MSLLRQRNPSMSSNHEIEAIKQKAEPKSFRLWMSLISICLVVFVTAFPTIVRSIGGSTATNYVWIANLTSIPTCRDARCDETKRGYFEFKQPKICERLKFPFNFVSVVIYTTPEHLCFISSEIITMSSPPN